MLRVGAMNYETEPVGDGPQWPKCVKDDVDWAKLFGRPNIANEEENCDDPWLTPRMAAKIHCTAIWFGEFMLEEFELGMGDPGLPKIVRKDYYKKSERWRKCFQDCFFRIALRLQNGRLPSPNCTGEEMAFHNIMELAPDYLEHPIGDPANYECLPRYPNDEDCEAVKDLTLKDDDVLMLFGPNDLGYDFSDDEYEYDEEEEEEDEYDEEDENEDKDEDDEYNANSNSSMPEVNFVPGSFLRTAHLHPRDWFLAFENDRFRDHLG